MRLSPWRSLILISLFFFLQLWIPCDCDYGLSPIGGEFLHDLETVSASISDDCQTLYYDQTLDHFNYRPESYTTFRQRYVINSKYWGGATRNAPILAFFGAEAPLDTDLSIIGFLADNAQQFQALILYIEHRYYGESIPFRTREDVLRNASTLGYFNSAQAMADYAEIITHVKETRHANNSPVIVIGASYGGMLASWFRLKYPHVALGALASSAPILYFDDITPQNGFYSIVSKDFKEASETCYQTIKKSWSEIDKAASQPGGLSKLSKEFKTCRPLSKSSELKAYLANLYIQAAQYNHPPSYPVTIVCSGMDGAPNASVLEKIFSGLSAYVTYVAHGGIVSCYVNEPGNISEAALGWQWQTCSEMVIPKGSGNDTMFEPDPFILSSYIEKCKSIYGVPPRPHWVTSYYGGHVRILTYLHKLSISRALVEDIKLILHRFGSNIIFSNGLRDPYSAGGVLDNISDTIVAVSTVNGSHCLDLHFANVSDPEWLVMQRKVEVRIIEQWITKYYADLLAYKK